MTLDGFKAMVAGYGERLLDQQELAVHSGFWAGYYSGMGRKKPVKTILEKFEKARYKKEGERAPDVEVDAFLEMERKFKEAQRKAQAGGDLSGR